MVEGPGFGEGQTGIYVKDITEGGPAQKVLQFKFIWTSNAFLTKVSAESRFSSQFVLFVSDGGHGSLSLFL